MNDLCSETDRRLWLYIDRELSASELARISSHLRECATCSSLYHERVRETRQYRAAFSQSPFGDKFVGKLRRRMVAEGLYGTAREDSSAPAGEAPVEDGDEVLPGETGSARHGRRARARHGLFPFHRGRMRRLVTVAAMLLLIPLIVVIGHMANGPTPEYLGDVTVENGAVFLEPPTQEPGGSVLGPRPSALHAGMVCRIPGEGKVTVKLRPGRGAGLAGGAAGGGDPDDVRSSWITLTGPASLSFDPKATCNEFLAQLEEGELVADVAPRAAGQSFRVETPQARVSVIGTIFELKVGEVETLLKVQKGKVRIQHREALPDQGIVEVAANDRPVVARRGESKPVSLPPPPVARPNPAPAPAPGATPPAALPPTVRPRPAEAPPAEAKPTPGDDLDNPVDGDAPSGISPGGSKNE